MDIFEGALFCLLYQGSGEFQEGEVSIKSNREEAQEDQDQMVVFGFSSYIKITASARLMFINC
jgi:hypothetical protein